MNITALNPISASTASPPVQESARVIEREQQRPWREAHRLAIDEVQEVLESHSLVPGVADHAHLLGEILATDDNRRLRVVLVRRRLPDSVVKENRNPGPIGGQWGPDLLLLRRESH